MSLVLPHSLFFPIGQPQNAYKQDLPFTPPLQNARALADVADVRVQFKECSLQGRKRKVPFLFICCLSAHICGGGGGGGKEKGASKNNGSTNV